MSQIQFGLVLLVVLGISLVNSECNGPPVFKRPEECCTFGKLISDALYEECKAKVNAALKGPPPPPRPPGSPLKGSCKTECVFNQTGYYANGALNEQQIRTTLVANAGAPFASLVNSAIDVCLPLARNRAAEFTATVASGENQCSPITLFFFICLNNNLIGNCPAANFQSSVADCTTLQTYARECPSGPK